MYFTDKEMACKCCGKVFIKKQFMNLLNLARIRAGIPFRINSAYRCSVHNFYCGGKSNSAHLYGWAADIKCEASTERYLILEALISVGFKRIGIYNDFIHVDCDPAKPEKVVWVG